MAQIERSYRLDGRFALRHWLLTAAASFSNDKHILEGSHLHLRALKSKMFSISKTKTGVFFVLAQPVTKWPNAISVSGCRCIFKATSRLPKR